MCQSEVSGLSAYSPCRNVSKFFLKTAIPVISVHILVWASMRIVCVYFQLFEKNYNIYNYFPDRYWVTLRLFKFMI